LSGEPARQRRELPKKGSLGDTISFRISLKAEVSVAVGEIRDDLPGRRVKRFNAVPPVTAPGAATGRTCRGGKVMSKGMDRKKEEKKKPAKSMKEKRAEKQAKRSGRG
jgi:hypothetical protein